MPPKPVRTVYQGTFIYPTSLTKLAILEDSSVWVDSDGVIKHVCAGTPGSRVEDMKAPQGWDEGELKAVRMDRKGMFWFPGFVGEFFWHPFF